MLRYLVVLSRPRFWLYLAGPILVGAAYGAQSLEAALSPTVGLLFVYFLVPANVYLYGINDVFDTDTDQHNPKKGSQEARYRGQRLVPGVVLATGIFLIPVAAVLPPKTWGYLLLWAVLATTYSAPPLRFKARPYLDSLSNGLYVLPGFAAYTALAGTHPPVAAILGAWAWAMAMHTFSAIPDIEPDRAAELETTATHLGEHGAFWYCGLLWTGAAFAFGTLDWRLGVALGTYPVLLWLVVRSDVPVGRAYWWYPAVNAVVGGVLTIGGLWRLVYG
ncbi:MAG: prenyltransferase [Halodesulfurarchaeum sp.]|nr:prenyltransferase [Halodesulfurarchaeum sp.]